MVTSAATVVFVILSFEVVCATVVGSVTETVPFNGIDVVSAIDFVDCVVIAVVSAVDDLIPSPIFLVLIVVVNACVVEAMVAFSVVILCAEAVSATVVVSVTDTADVPFNGIDVVSAMDSVGGDVIDVVSAVDERYKDEFSIC